MIYRTLTLLGLYITVVSGLSCPCYTYPEKFTPVQFCDGQQRSDDCDVIWQSPCHCCLTCARKVGEQCGTIDGIVHECSKDLYCSYRKTKTPVDDYAEIPGVCVRSKTETYHIPPISGNARMGWQKPEDKFDKTGFRSNIRAKYNTKRSDYTTWPMTFSESQRPQNDEPKPTPTSSKIKQSSDNLSQLEKNNDQTNAASFVAPSVTRRPYGDFVIGDDGKRYEGPVEISDYLWAPNYQHKPHTPKKPQQPKREQFQDEPKIKPAPKGEEGSVKKWRRLLKRRRFSGKRGRDLSKRFSLREMLRRRKMRRPQRSR